MVIHKVYSAASRIFRRKRMKQVEELFELADGKKILDVGGSQFNWKFVNAKPRVTIVNLLIPQGCETTDDQFIFEQGDGTNLKYLEKSFDLAFSNSVIEHLSTW